MRFLVSAILFSFCSLLPSCCLFFNQVILIDYRTDMRIRRRPRVEKLPKPAVPTAHEDPSAVEVITDGYTFAKQLARACRMSSFSALPVLLCPNYTRHPILNILIKPD